MKILPSVLLDFPKNWHLDDDSTVASKPAVADDKVAVGGDERIDRRLPEFAGEEAAEAAVLMAAANTEGLRSVDFKACSLGPGFLTILTVLSGNMVTRVMFLLLLSSVGWA